MLRSITRKIIFDPTNRRVTGGGRQPCLMYALDALVLRCPDVHKFRAVFFNEAVAVERVGVCTYDVRVLPLASHCCRAYVVKQHIANIKRNTLCRVGFVVRLANAYCAVYRVKVNHNIIAGCNCVYVRFFSCLRRTVHNINALYSDHLPKAVMCCIVALVTKHLNICGV